MFSVFDSIYSNVQSPASSLIRAHTLGETEKNTDDRLYELLYAWYTDVYLSYDGCSQMQAHADRVNFNPDRPYYTVIVVHEYLYKYLYRLKWRVLL